MERLEIRLEDSTKTERELKEIADKIIKETNAKQGYIYVKGSDRDNGGVLFFR